MKGIGKGLRRMIGQVSSILEWSEEIRGVDVYRVAVLVNVMRGMAIEVKKAVAVEVALEAVSEEFPDVRWWQKESVHFVDPGQVMVEMRSTRVVGVR